MSWLFGIKQEPTNIPSSSSPPGSTGDNSGNNGAQPKEAAQKTTSDAYRFDSSALERAAQAAKELEHSSNSNRIISIWENDFMRTLCFQNFLEMPWN